MNQKILIVDDKAENIAVLTNILEPLNYELVIALNAQEAFKRIKLYDFNLILLDIIMPDIDGYEVCKKFKANPKYVDIPIIFLTSLAGVENRIKAFECGGDDYITKPIIHKELLAKINLHLQKGMIVKALKSLLRKSYHELYNPLAIINTSLELQNMKYGNTKYMDSITVASKGLQIVYDDLYYSLSSKTQQENIITIELTKYIQDRINYFHNLAKSKNITINFHNFQKSNIQIREIDLQRIIDNTLSNAIKYAKPTSTVTIEVIDTKNFTILTSHNIGSTIKNPKKIFDKGYRENFEQIGMGIGLEIVSFICKNYKIQPKVTSENGATLFTYKIPKTN
ncbi:MAG: hybrid sensor histidine kinase/response regulator [Campylobacterota bacterium]|nr:hybrid sensor histidine kinase/response regulator [Campylobacterota bacterium]